MLGQTDSIVVTGGAGFVGSWLVPALLERTEAGRIVVLDNLFNGRRDHLPDSPRVCLQEVDLTDGGAVAEVIGRARPTWVFHLAALHYIPYCDAHPARTLEVNVVGTQHVLEACRGHEPARLVLASTVAVYPIGEGPNAEDDPAGPVDIYGLSKWMSEQLLELFSRRVSTRCAVARLSNVYGPRETNPHVLPEILDQMRAGRTEIALGNVKPKRDYIYAADVARGLLAITEGNEHPYRIYNVGTGREYSVEELVALLARISGRPLRVAVAADRVRPADRMHLLSDRGRIGRELGWRPRYSIEDGLAELWRDCNRGGPDGPALR